MTTQKVIETAPPEGIADAQAKPSLRLIAARGVGSSVFDGQTVQEADAALIAIVRRTQQAQKAARIEAILREPDL